MPYKSDDEDKRTRYDWLDFPEDTQDDFIPKEDAPSDSFFFDVDDKRADDLLIVSRLEGNVRNLKQRANAEIERVEKLNKKPAPLWARILFHSPDSKLWVIVYHVVFVSLMIFSVILFIWAMGLIF